MGFHGIFMGLYSDSTGFNEILWDFMGFSWQLNGISFDFMVLYFELD